MAEDDEVIFIGVSQTTVVSGGKHAIRACLNKVIEQLSTAVRNAKNLKHDFEYSLNEIPSSTMELFLNEQTQHVCNLMRNVETSFDEVRTILNAKLLLNSPLECEKKLEERPSSSSTTEENRMNLKTSHDVADGKSKQAEVDSPGDPNPGCSIDHTSEITSAKQQSCKESSNDAVESFARHVSELSHDSAKRSGAEAMSENGCEIELEGASSVTEKDTTLSANTAERNELVEDEVPTHEESAESNHHAETEFKVEVPCLEVPMSSCSDSDDSVVAEEDFKILEQIRKEKAAKRKSEKLQSNSKKKKAQSPVDSDDEFFNKCERLLSPTVRVSRRVLNSSDEEDAEQQSSGENKSNNSDDDVIIDDTDIIDKNSKPRIKDKKITKGLKEGRGISTEETPRTSRKRRAILSEEEDSEVEAIKKKTDKDLAAARRLLRESDCSDNDEVVKSRLKGKKSSKQRVLLSDDEDDDSCKSAESSVENDSDVDSDEEIIIKKPKKTRKKAKIIEDEDEDSSDIEPKKKKRKGLLTREDLTKETLDAEKAEKERRKRLEAKQKEFNGIELIEGEDDLAVALSGSQKLIRLKSIVLDRDENGDPPHPVEVHPSLVRILKKHQAEGIKFMYESAIESLDRINEPGGGGILAHCMGLGKTLQVISFLHTIMMHPIISEKVRRVLVVVPKNVVINWFKEFEKWLSNNDPDLDTLNVMELDRMKTHENRRAALKNWFDSDHPSVMIIGYDMFRILTASEDDKPGKRKLQPNKPPAKKNRKFAKLQEDFRYYLQDPGPDLIVCDEAHKLKNDDSALSKTMKRIKTTRRICLTGTPLQNNLMEYHCMVSFVKPGLLGTKTEFANRFANPIMRGRVKDATQAEVRFMQRRCHILFEHLKKCVDRKDYTVLTEAIPPKQEYVLNVRLTERQEKLYRAFLGSIDNDDTIRQRRLLTDFHTFSRICTHPYQIIEAELEAERKRIMHSEEDGFIDDRSEAEMSSSGSEDDDKDDDAGTSGSNNGAPVRASRRLKGESAQVEQLRDGTPPEYSGWFADEDLVTDDDKWDFSLSNKLVLLIGIIKKCEEIGDKLLIFSQSLESLRIIKRMLEHEDRNNTWFSDNHPALNTNWGWKEGRDYMVIDGSVQSSKRDAVQTAFNDPRNLRARLMLISTKAGSLGTNMVAANRVIIFDACWNPSHDTQSLFRVYRFGQTKPVYIYRLIAQGTMEECIYKRQVTKESTSMRVVDEAQLERHFAGHDLQELYRFTPTEFNDEPTFAPPRDRLLADVLSAHPSAVSDIIQHDTLFAQVEEEKLTEEERREAWEDYENEKNHSRFNVSGQNWQNSERQLSAQQQQILTQRLAMNKVVADPIYLQALVAPQMTQPMAYQLAFIKVKLEELLTLIPAEKRGGINEFTTLFSKLIFQARENGHSPAWLLREGVLTFQKVVPVIQSIPACKELLLKIRSEWPILFDLNPQS